MLINTRSVIFLIVTITTTQQAPQPWKASDLQQFYGHALEAILGIGIRLQTLLEDPAALSGKNFMVSPLSAALLVSQLMLGSEGKFRDELFNLLSLPAGNEHKRSVIPYQFKNVSYTLPYAQLHLQMGNLVKALEAKSAAKSFNLSSSNGLFVNESIKLSEKFIYLLGIYETDIKPLNFHSDPSGSQKAINDWVDLQTNGLIKIIFPTPLPASTSTIFTNAVYFAADWETPFSYETNMKGAFHVSKEKTVEVEYMQSFFEEIPYAESAKLGCRMMALPYKNNELAMYFIMPFDNAANTYTLNFGEHMKTKNLLELISQAKQQSVAVMIPKMKLTSKLSILEPLQRYAAFENKANDIKNEGKNKFDILDRRLDLFSSFNTSDIPDIVLSKAADNQLLRISNIVQEMTLSIDEKGTEAAAVTAGIVEYMGGSKNFRVDKPFIFFIRHTLTSTILFWGAITDPTKSQ